MQVGWDILWFIIGVSLLVTVHEFGHFWVARQLGFKVLRFSVGFGKPLYKRIGRAPDHTEYVIAALPLGGYVRMLDERDGPVPPEDLPRAFANKPPWKRILVMLAGPAANILFAVIVLWIAFANTGQELHKPIVGDVRLGSPAAIAGLRSGDEILSIGTEPTPDHSNVMIGLLDMVSGDGTSAIDVRGKDGLVRHLTLSVADADERHKLTEPMALFRGLGFEFWRPPTPPRLGEVVPGGPAARSGLKPGDLVVAADDKRIQDYKDLADYINARPGETLRLDVRRGGQALSFRVNVARDQDGDHTIGRIYIKLDPAAVPPYPAELTTHVRFGPVESLGMSVQRAWELTAMQAKFFVRMLTGHVSFKNLSGAISIAEYAGDSARAGAESFVQLLIVLSLSLGFLNLLPIPILDGGQIVFQIAEWVRGRPLSDRIYLVGQQAGLLLLVLLMGVALFNDISGIAARP
jgi:regulator of sigma E protease